MRIVPSQPLLARSCDTIANGAGTSSFNPWIVLSNIASPNPIGRGQSTTSSASFLQNSASTALTAAQVSALVGLPVSWGGATQGTLANQQATIQTNGRATATFTNNNTCNNGSANASVDNATATAGVTVQCFADLTATKTNNVSGSAVVGQGWIWTITVGNVGDSSASFASGQTILTDNLPNSASISYGSPSASLAGVSCAIKRQADCDGDAQQRRSGLLQRQGWQDRHLDGGGTQRRDGQLRRWDGHTVEWIVRIDRVVDGKIVEHWGEANTTGMLAQLGVRFVPDDTAL